MEDKANKIKPNFSPWTGSEEDSDLTLDLSYFLSNLGGLREFGRDLKTTPTTDGQAFPLKFL